MYILPLSNEGQDLHFVKWCSKLGLKFSLALVSQMPTSGTVATSIKEFYGQFLRCGMSAGVHMPQRTCGGQRTTLGSRLLNHGFRDITQVIRFAKQVLLPSNHLTGPLLTGSQHTHGNICNSVQGDPMPSCAFMDTAHTDIHENISPIHMK